ncbi:hypothetical protein MPSEU_001039300 [Mayamaea pseudoterrestris]|nr:hypothetical protein MPSEU_001039300 [Mayamaea pseudoterrestris]
MSSSTTEKTTKNDIAMKNSTQGANHHDEPIPPAIKPKLPLATISGRVIDTAEDAVAHLKRLPYNFGWVPENLLSGNETLSSDTRPTVLILGSGWAAHALLKVADTTKLRIIVVSPTNHFVFTPMLSSACVGTVEYRSMTEAIRAANPLLHQYIEGTAVGVNLEQQTVTVQLQSLLTSTRNGAPLPISIRYDKLVVAVGSRVNDAVVKGAAQYCLRLKTCDDAKKLRNAIGESLEYASRPDVCCDEDSLTGRRFSETERRERQQERRRRVTFCIVGGGPTGCELAGELSDFFRDTTKPRVGVFSKLRDDIRIVLIHGGNELVQQFDPNLRTHALKSLRKQGVDVRLDTYVEECGDGYIKLKDKYTGKQELLLNGLTVWAAGVGPSPFVAKLLDMLPDEARGPNGRVFVDKWMRCPVPPTAETGSVLVLGDAAAFDADDNGKYLPQTAQVAGQQGAFAARLLDRGYDMTTTPPTIPKNDTTIMANWLRLRGLEQAAEFDFLNLGLLAYVGGSEALSQIEIGDVPILSYAGSISFLLWRSVYLVKQVATRNRVLVTFDWIKSYVFGRDVTRL